MKKKVCLICSAGGHLNQIKELIDPFSAHFELVVITLDREDSRSLLKNNKAFFIHDIEKNIGGLLKNIADSIFLFLKLRPSIIITTGAGAAFTFCVFGRLMFRKLIFIESFARVNAFSLFGKYMKFFAHKTFVQWPGLKEAYPKAIYAGPIFNFDFQFNHKKRKNKIFATVGSTEYPFDRLLIALDKIKENGNVQDEIIAQTGTSTYKPVNYEYFHWCTTEEIYHHFEESRIVITHAGTGSIINALYAGARVITVPRLLKYKEHNDDHQLEIASEFHRRELVKMVKDLDQLEQIILEMENFIPKNPREGTNLIKYLLDLLNSYNK